MVSSLQASSAEFSYLSFRQFKPALSLNRWIKQVIFLFEIGFWKIYYSTVWHLPCFCRLVNKIQLWILSFFKDEKTCCVSLPVLESIISVHNVCILSIVQILFTKWNCVACGCFTVWDLWQWYECKLTGLSPCNISCSHGCKSAFFFFWDYYDLKNAALLFQCFVTLSALDWHTENVCQPFCRIVYPIHCKWVNPIPFIPFVSLLGNLKDGKLLGV